MMVARALIFLLRTSFLSNRKCAEPANMVGFFSPFFSFFSFSVVSVSSLFAQAEEVCLRKFQKSGSCAAVCVLDRTNSKLVCGNVGDCIVVHGDTVLTKSHRADDEEERARVLAAGGWIADGRVFGVLQPTRTLGDHDLKKKIPPPPLNRKAQKALLREGKTDEREPSVKRT
jgi:serine/threonine protein phosphatase PrpC